MQFGLYSLFQSVKDSFGSLKKANQQYGQNSLYNKYADYRIKNDNSSRYNSLNNNLSFLNNSFSNFRYNLLNFDSKSFMFNKQHDWGSAIAENEKNNMLRHVRVNEYDMMEELAEIASTLDIVAEESVQPDENGDILTIRSPYKEVVSHIEGLFFGILNMENNLYSYIRNMNKYGDEFCEMVFNENFTGIVGLVPARTRDIECVINTNDNMTLNEKILYRHKGIEGLFTDKEILQFKLSGDSRFEPYGHSILEKARRIWRQVNLLEDAIMIHFLVRTPMRRVFSIDVTGIPKELHYQHMQMAKSNMSQNSVVDPTSGNIDKRNITLDMMQDFYIPMINGNALARIENIEGDTKDIGQISGFAIYQSKLFSALGVPKPYLNYDDDTGNKSLLAQEDVKFSRKILRNHQCILQSLYKLAYIDMIISNKFTEEQIKSLELGMTNPSTISETLKLDLMTKKLDIARNLSDMQLTSQKYILNTLFEFSDDEIKTLYKQRSIEKHWNTLIEAGQFHTSLTNPDQVTNAKEYGINNVDLEGQSQISGVNSTSNETNKDNEKSKGKNTSTSNSGGNLNKNNSAQHITQLIQPATNPNLMNVANEPSNLSPQTPNVGTQQLFTSKFNKYHYIGSMVKEYIFDKLNKKDSNNKVLFKTMLMEKNNKSKEKKNE